VAHADLMLGSGVEEVLQAEAVAAAGRLRGIRYVTPFDDSELNRFVARPVPAHRLADPAFREGFARLAPLGLSFDAWVYHPQISDLTALADAFPGTSIVLDHACSVLGVGPYAGRQQASRTQWARDLRELARRDNVSVKLGGLGMPINGFGFHELDTPPTSDTLARAWKPWVETSIDLFRPERCMFESNFPVDKQSCGYSELWNAFKRLTTGFSVGERTSLFSGTAARVYRMQAPGSQS
ncbi:MAG: amidohydrolase 2, partial [Polaromonas sp.]|nr:amidohydrolase 2 [Polaromonas sp.]